MTQYSQHPLSAAFPPMTPIEFGELVADIRDHGQRDPITIYNNQVLDGWHRYRACTEIGIPCTVIEFTGDDAVAFVISKNLHRRQLDSGQRGVAVVKVRAWRPPSSADQGKQTTIAVMGATVDPINSDVELATQDTNPPTATNAQMAAEAGVSTNTIKRAKRAVEAGLGDAVLEGKVTVAEAAEIAKLPETERAAAIENPPAREMVKTTANVMAGDKDKARIAELEGEIAALRAQASDQNDQIAELALNLEEAVADLASMAKTVEGNEPILAALAEAKQFRAENAVLKDRVNGLMHENNEHIRLVKHWRSMAENLDATA